MLGRIFSQVANKTIHVKNISHLSTAISPGLECIGVKKPVLPTLISVHQKPISCDILKRTLFDTPKLQTLMFSNHQLRHYHASGSKVRYLDFRYKMPTNHLRLHLLIIRRKKMKKHQRRKFRRKFKCLLAKKRLKREIAKEKTFRVELLSMIRTAESFDPKEFALRKIAEANNKPREITKEEKYEQLKELIRTNRYQVTYVKPKHPYLRSKVDSVTG